MADSSTNERLLRAVAEQLKLPLLQIARLSDEASSVPEVADINQIAYIAETALRLVDGFLLSANSQNQDLFQMEPVSIASVLNETAYKLAPLARQNDCDLELSVSGRHGPVMANHRFLESALILLGYGIIESRASDNNRRRVILATHKSSQGLTAGIFDDRPGIGIDNLRRGRALFGDAKQAVPTTSGSSGASIFVADALFKTMETTLRVARHKKLTGLAATFNLSAQLSIL